jgi:hypothetical protein
MFLMRISLESVFVSKKNDLKYIKSIYLIKINDRNFSMRCRSINYVIPVINIKVLRIF